MGLVRDSGITAAVSGLATPGEPQPSGRTLEEAALEIGQRPLLPADVPVGITVAVARRSRTRLAEFHGWGDADIPPTDEQEKVAQLCVLVVSETSLVHYTKRPKPLRAVPGAASTKGSAQSTEAAPPVDEKYWKRRYNYFARFDEGIRMDPAAWFEVTPESVARHIADRMRYDLVVDGTCGVGGNAIQFALSSRRVIAVDTMAERLKDAAHNARIYGVEDRIEFVCDDFAHFAETYSGPQIDAVFLSPPWGGPAHLDAEHFALKDVECPDIIRLFAAAATVSKRVALYLPRHADLHEMVLLAAAHGFAAVEVEKVFFEYPTPHLKLCVIYFTPEAASKPPPAMKSSKKKVGPTGRAIGKADLVEGRSTAIAKPVSYEPSCSMPSGLLGLPPLAGPLFRALYCRFHYVGKYAVAAALAFDRTQAEGSSSSSRGHGRPAVKPKSACMSSQAPEGRLAPMPGRQGFCHPALRTPLASALCKAFAVASGSVSGSAAAEQELITCLAWLLAEVPIDDLVRLAVEAEPKVVASPVSVDLPPRSSTAGEHAVAMDGADIGTVSSATDTWGFQLIQLVKQQLPEVHRRMLDWRKAAALKAASMDIAS